MSKNVAGRLGRLTAATALTVAFVGLGGGVAFADDSSDGTIQDVGKSVSKVEKKTGVSDVEEKVDEATGVDKIDDATGVTKAEKGLGLE